MEWLEPVYARLQCFFGTSMPARITVRYHDRDHSMFDPNTSSVAIAREHLNRAKSSIAHESSHLALHTLTQGAVGLAELWEIVRAPDSRPSIASGCCASGCGRTRRTGLVCLRDEAGPRVSFTRRWMCCSRNLFRSASRSVGLALFRQRDR